jgi:CIC family chloride channel protein
VLARFNPTKPLGLELLGRTLLHTALVGLAAGLFGAAFFAGLEWVQHVLLEGLAGYVPLRAFGESIAGHAEEPTVFRPWVLLLLPGLGALASGLISSLAPETRGGGGDAMIHSFHHEDSDIRPRVIGVKALASIFTLGTGGSGGREGPTMQIGGALGSLVGRLLKVTPRERRVLMVAGVAAGISAVFRTPLGAALLAVECLYTDDFEAEALVPAVLASVISYSVVISIFGESTLFARSPRYPFVIAHLPYYGLMAVLLALAAMVFLKVLRSVQAWSAASSLPVWARPAVGGLALSLLAVPLVMWMGDHLHAPGQGMGLLGGGYGAAQMAITGSALLPTGWLGVEFLLGLGVAKALASSFTIGTGGSAGDFAPSMVLGALLGGAFGRAAALLTGDPRLDAGAFALVGMGAFYGGMAHVPLAALILVSELAGSYDLLVPLMLAEAIALVMLRNHKLYDAQVQTQHDSPAHRQPPPLHPTVLGQVASLVQAGRAFLSVSVQEPWTEAVARLSAAPDQRIFPVLDEGQALVGLLPASTMGAAATAEQPATVKALMQPPLSVRTDDDLRRALELLLVNDLGALPVVDAHGKVLGLLSEAELAQAYLTHSQRRPS